MIPPKGPPAAAAAGIRVMPGLSAGVAATAQSGDAGLGALTAACVIAAAAALERSRHPLHLMPIAGLVARHAAVVVGLAGAFAISLAFTPITGEVLTVALIGGWIALDALLIVVAKIEQHLASRVAVIGSEGLLRALRGELALAGIGTYEVVGRIEAGSGLVGPAERPAIGWIDELEELVMRERLDLLVGGATSTRRHRRRGTGSLERRVTEKVSSCCLRLPVSYIGANEFFEELFAHVPLGRIDATWFEYVLHPGYRTASPLAKRVLGLLGATVMLIAAAPVIAVAAIAIRLEDGGPVLFRQRRIGERGREFEVLKLRTMRVADPEGDVGPVGWSAAADTRITRVGAILRAAHLDELPQLWNVIRGEMALVGPRPERPELVAALERRLPFYGRRHLMRPGISGWAQVRCGYSGSVTGAVWKLAHDLFYLKHGSALFDLMIVLETLATPVRDRRMARRLPDPVFVLEAIREEHEAGEAPPETDLGIEVTRRRFRPRPARAPGPV